MLAQGSGIIINISSKAGKVGLANMGPYVASKFALEGMADGLRRTEAKRNGGAKVILVKPGNVRTGMNSYGEDGPEVVTAAVRHALRSRTPKHRYHPGRIKGYRVWLICWLFNHLPTWLSDKLLR